MRIGIYIIYTSAHYHHAQALAYWRKLAFNILGLLEWEDTYQVSYLTTLHFVLFHQQLPLQVTEFFFATLVIKKPTDNLLTISATFT